jgi:hypothetical protein
MKNKFIKLAICAALVLPIIATTGEIAHHSFINVPPYPPLGL